MSEPRIASPFAISLGDGSIETTYATDEDGREYAILHIGGLVNIHVSSSSVETLGHLADQAMSLEAWRRSQPAEPIRTPDVPVVDAAVPTLRVPDYGRGAA